MKHTWYYIQWLFKDFDAWNLTLVASLIANLTACVFSLYDNDPAYRIASGIGWACMAVFFARMIYELERLRYRRFKQEQAEIVKTLRSEDC